MEIRLPRILRIWRSPVLSRSISPNRMRSALTLAPCGVSFSSERPVSDLPEPDSPTIATFSRPTEKEIPRTAWFSCRWPLNVMFRFCTSSNVSVMAQIQYVAQAVTEQVERQAGEKNRQAGNGGNRPVSHHELAAGREHRAPFRTGCLCPEAEKSEAGGGQDNPRHIQRQAHHHRRQTHRNDVAQDDAHLRCTLQTHGGDVIHFADRQSFGASQTGNRRPGGK